MQEQARPAQYLSVAEYSADVDTATQAAAWIEDSGRHPAFLAQLQEVRGLRHRSGSNAPAVSAGALPTSLRQALPLR